MYSHQLNYNKGYFTPNITKKQNNNSNDKDNSYNQLPNIEDNNNKK